MFEFLNIDIVCPVRNNFQQDVFAPSDLMTLSKSVRVLHV